MHPSSSQTIHWWIFFEHGIGLDTLPHQRSFTALPPLPATSFPSLRGRIHLTSHGLAHCLAAVLPPNVAPWCGGCLLCVAFWKRDT